MLVTDQTPEQSVADARILGSRILVVDDVGLMRKMIGHYLAVAGFEDVIYATDGDQVASLVEEQDPALIILDINMPTMSGYEVCKVLRSDPKTAALPILIQSAVEAPQERAEAFEVGATDFVSKPINPPEMIARVKIHLENQLLIKDLSHYKSHMDRELSAARSMQESLLPRATDIKELETKYGAHIESDYQASFELGGDLWGGWAIDENRIGLFVLDMTGHGVGSALNTFRAHATMRQLKNMRADPAAFLTALNSELYGELPLGQFATMFYGVIDFDAETLTFSGAGAPQPIIFNDGEAKFIDSSGYPVGIIETPDYETRRVSFPKGTSLFCYSDVLVEQTQADGSLLGEDGFFELVSNRVKDARGRSDILTALLADVLGADRGALSDDLTAVILHSDKPVTGG